MSSLCLRLQSPRLCFWRHMPWRSCCFGQAAPSPSPIRKIYQKEVVNRNQLGGLSVPAGCPEEDATKKRNAANLLTTGGEKAHDIRRTEADSVLKKTQQAQRQEEKQQWEQELESNERELTEREAHLALRKAKLAQWEAYLAERKERIQKELKGKHQTVLIKRMIRLREMEQKTEVVHLKVESQRAAQKKDQLKKDLE